MASQSAQQCQCVNPAADSLLSDLQPIDLTVATHYPRGLSPAVETELLAEIRQTQGKERQRSLLTLWSDYAQVVALMLNSCRQWCRVNGWDYDEKKLILVAQIGFYRMVDEYQPGSCVDFTTCVIESMRRSMMYTLLLGRASSHEPETH